MSVATLVTQCRCPWIGPQILLQPARTEQSWSSSSQQPSPPPPSCPRESSPLIPGLLIGSGNQGNSLVWVSADVCPKCPLCTKGGENKSSLLERLCTAKGRYKELIRTVRFSYVKLRPKVVLRFQAWDHVNYQVIMKQVKCFSLFLTCYAILCLVVIECSLARPISRQP